MTPPAPQTAAVQPLWTRQFMAQCAIQFLLFCNMSVFFRYVSFLEGVGLDTHQAGLLVGAFSLIGLLARPILSPLLPPGRTLAWMLWSALATVATLLAYNLAQGFNAWLLVRLAHGLAYTVLAIAATAALVACIPPGRSGEAFGVLGVVTLLPYALLPPLVVPLESHLGGYLNLLSLTGLTMLGILPLAWLGRGAPAEAAGGQGQSRISLPQLRENFRSPGVSACLVLSLGVYSAFAALFYLVEPVCVDRELAGAGWFFSAAYFSEIAVRLVAGKRLDRVDKRKLLAVAAAWLAACFVLTALVTTMWQLVVMGLAFGLGWGVAFPLLNALVFDYSEPGLRALNINLGMLMFQGGFFLGPWLGAMLLGGGGAAALFLACAGLCLAAGLATLALRRPGPTKERP